MDTRTKQRRFLSVILMCLLLVGLYQHSWDTTETAEDDITYNITLPTIMRQVC